MKGLLKKDLLLLKSQIKYIVTIVVICLIMAYANSGFAYISSYLTFMGTGLVFNSFSYDMYHNEMTYLFALPFSKREYCLEKYLCTHCYIHIMAHCFPYKFRNSY